MAGRILTDDGGRALDSNGNPISGAKLKAFTAGTATAVSLYTRRALDVTHASPVVANGAGFFPQIWAADRALLDIKLYAADDVSFTTPLRTFLDVTPQGEGGEPAEVGVDDSLLEVLTDNEEVKFVEGVTYEITETIDLSALSGRRIYLNGATIRAQSSFDGPHILAISGDTHIYGPGTFNGSNLSDPSSEVASVTAIARGTTTTITVSSAHNFKEGQPVVFAGLGGTTQLNGTGVYYVVSPTSLTFQIQNAAGDLDTTAYGAFTGGGTATFSDVYAAGAYAGVAVFISGGGDYGSIEGVTFEDFPGGPILHDSRTTRYGFMVSRCRFLDVQTYTGGATNAVVAFHGVLHGLQVDCYLELFNWKGFYFSESYYCQIVRCHTHGGNNGHASHYISEGADCAILDCIHVGESGVGFGFKLSDTTRPKVLNFIAIDARSGGQVQGAEDFVVDGLTVWDSATSSLFVEGSITYGAVTRGKVKNFRGRRSTPGTTVNHRGIYVAATAKLSVNITGITKANPAVVTAPGHILNEAEAVTIASVGGMTEVNGNTYYVQNPDYELDTFELRTETGNLNSTAFGTYTTGGTASAGGSVDRLMIRDSYFENYLYGIFVDESGFQQTNIDIIDNQMVNIGQYGILAYLGSGRIAGNRIALDGSSTQACIAVYGDGVTTTGILEIANNELTGSSGDVIHYGEAGATDDRGSFDQVRIIGNRARSGANFLTYRGNVNVADVVNQLVITDNTGTGLTAGLNVTFNEATNIKVTIRDNVLLTAAFAAAADTITKPAGAGVVAYRQMVLTGSATWDPGSLADGAGETSAAIAVVGANFGDTVTVAAPYDMQGIVAHAYVSAADEVKIRIQNETTGVIDLGSGTWRVRVTKT